MIKQLILLLSLCLSVNLFAQKKHDNTFVIPHHVSSQKIKSVLFQNGYELAAGSDTSFLYTLPKKLGKTVVIMKINFAITDTAVYIKGMAKVDKNDPAIWALYKTLNVDTEPQFMPIEINKPSKKGDSWDEIERIAKILSADVFYIKQ